MEERMEGPVPGDDDLYGDLYADLGQGKKVLKTELEELEERYQRSQAQVQELSEKTAKLEEERKILVKNMSALFKTAQIEVKRKDGQISELRSDLTKARNFISTRLKQLEDEREQGAGLPKPGNRGEERSRSADLARRTPDEASYGRGPGQMLEREDLSSRDLERDIGRGASWHPPRSRFESR